MHTIPLHFPSMIAATGVDQSLLGQFFGAAAALYQTAPWDDFNSESPIGVRFPAEAPPRPLVIMGGAGDSYGLAVCENQHDWLRMQQVSTPMELASGFRWLALSFEPGEFVAPVDKEAAARNGWPLAGDALYAVASRIGPPEPGLHAPQRDDLLWLVTVLPALVQAVQAWRTRQEQANETGQWMATFDISGFTGPAQVTLSIPWDKLG